jgi:D-alanine-D-alanine ligase
MPTERLLLIFGGRSSEHEISIRSATEVLAAVDRSRFDPIPLAIRRDGGWRTGSADLPLAALAAEGEVLEDPGALLRTADVVFPLLHGPYGEDGTIQGLLEVYDLPYVGSGVLASSLCMDKAAFKHHVGASPHDVPVVPDVIIDRRITSAEDALARVEAAVDGGIGFPCFVKPANQGSSIGVSKASDRDSLPEALELAARYDPKIVVEQGIDAREIELAVLGDGGPDTIVSLAGEIVLPEGVWYDYASKYEDDVASLALPTELPQPLLERLQELALRAFRATGCHGLARIDFFVDRKTGAAYLNEVNTMPGFTSISMYPKLIENAGIPYGDLISRLCELAVERHQRKAELSIDK